MHNAPHVQRRLLQREGNALLDRLIGFQDHCQIAETLGPRHLRLLTRPDALPERLDHRDQPTGVAGTLPGLCGTALRQSEPGGTQQGNRILNAWCELITDGYTEGAPSR